MDLEKRILHVKRVRCGKETEKWGEAHANVEQVALLRPVVLTISWWAGEAP